MCKKEVFRAALSAVAAETEIPEDCILSRCKRREVVDARYMLVAALLDAGLYANEIARLTRLTGRAIEVISSNFDRRRAQSGRIFDVMYQRISSSVRVSAHSLMSC